VTPNEVVVEKIEAVSVVHSLSDGSEEYVGILTGPILFSKKVSTCLGTMLVAS